MPAGELLVRLGEKRAVDFRESSDTDITIASVTATIRNSADVVGVSAEPGGSTEIRPNREYDLFYLWTPAAEGLYRGTVDYLLNGAARRRYFTAWVIPLPSAYDRWVEQVARVVQDHATGEDTQLLSYRDYAVAADAAVLAYSRSNPRLLRKLVTLTASDWTYLLSELATGITPTASWVEGLSAILRLEYPVDATIQSRTVLGPLDVEVDERAAEWRFRYSSPSAGETAYVTWSTLHLLSSSASTVPELDFGAVAKYAAGECLAMLGTRAIHLDAPQIAAEFAQSFQSRREQYSAQAKELMRAARQEWRRPVWSL